MRTELARPATPPATTYDDVAPPDTRQPDAAAAAVRRLLASGALEVPVPGDRTRVRFAALRRVSAWDVVVGRLAEAHLDAVAILAELGGRPPAPGELWGVWAAEAPPGVRAERDRDGWRLYGRKSWCSGAGSCSHALVTASTDGHGGDRRLFAVDLGRGARPVDGTWAAVGMAGSDSRAVELTAAPAEPVGGVGEYLTRPGFWHGAAGVAACWLGGADGVLAPLRARAGRLDPHGLAHLGAADAAVFAAGVVLDRVADDIDADPSDRTGGARVAAMRARAVVEATVSEVVDRVGRALGAGPLCLDPAHARRVADLPVYVRQSHAERDLADLGALVGGAA